MHSTADLLKYRETDAGTELLVRIPQKIGEILKEKYIHHAEMRFDDGRMITVEQRKKAYATIRDIADWTGYFPEEQKELLKYLHMAKTGCDYFSLSDCTVDEAREFINTIIEYAIENGVQLTDMGVNRTDDIGKYLYYCLKASKCAVCGRDGEIHHVDAIGMGNDRRTLDDSNHRKICLCRTHHTMAHQLGMQRFTDRYKVYGIIVKENKR